MKHRLPYNQSRRPLVVSRENAVLTHEALAWHFRPRGCSSTHTYAALISTWHNFIMSFFMFKIIQQLLSAVKLKQSTNASVLGSYLTFTSCIAQLQLLKDVIAKKPTGRPLNSDCNCLNDVPLSNHILPLNVSRCLFFFHIGTIG